jgi:hypothetical protein
MRYVDTEGEEERRGEETGAQGKERGRGRWKGIATIKVDRSDI